MTIRSTLLKDLLLVTRDGDWGQNVPKEGFVPYRVIRGGDFPEARIGDISSVPRCYLSAGTVSRRTLVPNDILIETAGGTRDRPTGRTLLVNERLLQSLGMPATCASFCRFLRVDPEKVEPRYVFWYLQYLYDQGVMWEHQVQHTGIARFQYTRFAETVRIPLIPRLEQQAIARILGSIDDKIELNHRMNQTLESIAQALFRSWFVDFEPVSAKREGRKPVGMDAATAALFPEHFQETNVGPIPVGWRVEKIENCIVRHGVGVKYDQKTVIATGKVPVLDQGKSGVIGYHNDEPGVIASVNEPIIVFANHTCYMRLVTFPFSAIQNVLPFTGKNLNTIWTFYATDGVQEFLEYKGHWPDFVINKIVIPPEQLTHVFGALVSCNIKRIRQNEVQIESLAKMRDALLFQLFSGELRVEQAEEMIP